MRNPKSNPKTKQKPSIFDSLINSFSFLSTQSERSFDNSINDPKKKDVVGFKEAVVHEKPYEHGKRWKGPEELRMEAERLQWKQGHGNDSNEYNPSCQGYEDAHSFNESNELNESVSGGNVQSSNQQSIHEQSESASSYPNAKIDTFDFEEAKRNPAPDARRKTQEKEPKQHKKDVKAANTDQKAKSTSNTSSKQSSKKEDSPDGEEEGSVRECLICMEDTDDPLACGECNHIFCKKCYDEYKSKGACVHCQTSPWMVFKCRRLLDALATR